MDYFSFVNQMPLKQQAKAISIIGQLDEFQRALQSRQTSQGPRKELEALYPPLISKETSSTKHSFFGKRTTPNKLAPSPKSASDFENTAHRFSRQELSEDFDPRRVFTPCLNSGRIEEAHSFVFERLRLTIDSPCKKLLEVSLTNNPEFVAAMVQAFIENTCGENKVKFLHLEMTEDWFFQQFGFTSLRYLEEQDYGSFDYYDNDNQHSIALEANEPIGAIFEQHRKETFRTDNSEKKRQLKDAQRLGEMLMLAKFFLLIEESTKYMRHDLPITAGSDFWGYDVRIW